MKIIFFGTPHFAAEVLQHLLDNGVNIVAVVTKPDKAQGRSGTPMPTPVKLVAQTHRPSLPIYQPEIVSDLEYAPLLKKYDADLFVVVAYGEIMKQHLLDMPKVGCINLHASILPKYRGAAPIQHCLINGETESGVSIMHMAKKMDAGDVISIVKVPIDNDMTYGELEKSLLHVGSRALLETIRDFEKGITHRHPQDHTQATFAPKIELEDCEIHWNLPAQTLHNLVRGVNPHPGAWCFVKVKGQKKRLKIIKTAVVTEVIGKPGEVLVSNKEKLIIGCALGSLCLMELQLEGKKPMLASELLRGIPIQSWQFIL